MGDLEKLMKLEWGGDWCEGPLVAVVVGGKGHLLEWLDGEMGSL